MMKKMIMTFVACIALACSAAITPTQIAAMTNETLFVKSLTKDNMPAVFDACLTAKSYENAWRCVLLTTNRAWQVRWLDTTLNDNEYIAISNNVYTVASRTCWNKFGLLPAEETEQLRIANKAFNTKIYKVAAIATYHQALQKTFIKKYKETNALREWKIANSQFLCNYFEQTKNYNYCMMIATSIFYYDVENQDYSCSLSMPLFKKEYCNFDQQQFVHFLKCRLNGKRRSSLRAGYKYTFFNTVYDIAINNATTPFALNAIIHYKNYGVTDLYKKYWTKLNKNPYVARSVAIKLKDIDKKIDSYLMSVERLTPKNINVIIKEFNGLDVDYRKADVLKILRNINSKYTLNLYDDRDTWEPILAKIRAMIEVRQ